MCANKSQTSSEGRYAAQKDRCWVLNWNTPSIAFYESLGARPQDEWTVYRLADGALGELGAAK
ncbi:hypothetical protein BG418_31875 [Streptomyces sp. CBMA152]|nr:hypothetical protein [Streptomyces sp. CBMA152]